MHVDDGGWDREHPRAVALFEVLARVLIAPLIVAHRLRLLRFESGSQLLSLAPGTLGVLVRRVWYRALLASCGERLRVGFGAMIRYRTTRIGDDCAIGFGNRIGFADIGDHFMSSDYVTVMGGRHQHGSERGDVPMRFQPGELTRVVVGDDVWAGAGAVVLADVAAHSLIAAGAVVTQAFPEWSTIGGVPAKLIGERR
jgi:virginiamycin A acetyltransferase